MTNWKGLSVILIFLTVHGSDAQYKLLTRGEPSPYDSGVVTRLDRYREETKKFDLADKLIDSLKAEINSMSIYSFRKDTTILIMTRMNAEQTKTISRQQITIDDLNFNMKRIIRMTEGKTILGKLIRRKEVWFGAGFITAILISK